MITYTATAEFLKEFKKLEKRFRTLNEDFTIAKTNAIELYHIKQIDNHSVFPVSGLKFESPKIFKLRKFACRSLRGKGVKSGMRIIYAFFEKIQTVEFIYSFNRT